MIKLQKIETKKWECLFVCHHFTFLTHTKKKKFDNCIKKFCINKENHLVRLKIFLYNALLE